MWSMISIAQCRKILNQNGNNYSDEEIKKIRDFLYFIAEIEYENFKKTEFKKNEKASTPLHPGIN
jgi:hypothetical protein